MKLEMLREALALLREAGVQRAKLPVSDDSICGSCGVLEVEFLPPEPPQATPLGQLVGKDGKPVNLDEGMPEELTRDPILAANTAPKAS